MKRFPCPIPRVPSCLPRGRNSTEGFRPLKFRFSTPAQQLPSIVIPAAALLAESTTPLALPHDSPRLYAHTLTSEGSPHSNSCGTGRILLSLESRGWLCWHPLIFLLLVPSRNSFSFFSAATRGAAISSAKSYLLDSKPPVSTGCPIESTRPGGAFGLPTWLHTCTKSLDFS